VGKGGEKKKKNKTLPPWEKKDLPPEGTLLTILPQGGKGNLKELPPQGSNKRRGQPPPEAKKANEKQTSPQIGRRNQNISLGRKGGLRRDTFRIKD